MINRTVRLTGRIGGALPGRKVLTLVHAMVAGGSHIDHADILRSGATQAVLPHRVMASSTLGTFLRAFSFGHVRQLDAVVGVALARAWAAGAGPGKEGLVVDVDHAIWPGAGLFCWLAMAWSVRLVFNVRNSLADDPTAERAGR